MADNALNEKILLKFIYTDSNIADRAIPFISDKLFYDINAAKIVKKTIDYVAKYSKLPNLSEIKLELDKQEEYDYLIDALNVDISIYNKDFILDKIRDFIRERSVFVNLSGAMDKLRDNKLDEVGDLPDKLRESLSFSFDTKVGLDFFEEPDRLYDFLHDVGGKTVSTGLGSLDINIGGGWHEKTLNIYIAGTNIGKTLVMSSGAISNVLNNHNVLYVTCEISEEKISERNLASLFDYDIGNLINLSRDEFMNVFSRVKKAIKKKLIIKEYPPATINVNHIRNLLKELEIKKKFSPNIIYVDYLALMKSITSKRDDASHAELLRISEELRALAVEQAIPIVTAMQINRGGFKSSSIDLGDVAGSFATNFTADIVIGITQSDELVSAGKYCFTIMKSRYGGKFKKLYPLVDINKMKVYDEVKNPNELLMLQAADRNKVAAAVEKMNNIDDDATSSGGKFITW